MYTTQLYDDALAHILNTGKRRRNRTGIDCLTVPSIVSTYFIENQFPLLTKRRLFPKAVFAELIWMLSGSTDNEELRRLGANFWTPWVDPSHSENKAFYERTGFPPNLLGPVYGWQMRHFGANYLKWVFEGGCKNPPEFYGGVDQMSNLVNEIRANPHSRRHIVSLWNPVDLPIQRLPPCHYAFHVMIDDEDRMTLILNQRSCDFPVGVPANIQFYSALCIILAQQTGYEPYCLIHHAEDAHIYVDQIPSVTEYLSREPKPSPKLKVNKAANLFSYKVDDFVVEGYDPHPSIKIPVTV